MRRLTARLLAVVPEGLIHRAARLRRRSRVADRLARRVKGLAAVDMTIPRGAAKGLRFNAFGTNAGYLTGTKEHEVEQAFTDLLGAGKTVYDLGAAVGFYTVIAAREVGPSGRVIAFEPLPVNAGRLTHNVGLNGFANVEHRNEAVGAEPGTATFRLGKADTQGRLAALPGTPASVGEGEIQVSITTLDALVAGGTVPPPEVIKMDIEGAEVEALQGARALLAEHRPALFMEMHGRGAEVAALLEDAGYTATVVGDERPLASAPWSCHVVAVPA